MSSNKSTYRVHICTCKDKKPVIDLRVYIHLGIPKIDRKKLGLFKNHSYPYTFKILAMIHICLLARIFLQKNNHCEYSQAKKKQYVHQKMKRQKPIYLSRSGTGEKHILAISDKLLGLFIY